MLTDIKDLLEAHNLGTFEVDLFIGTIPEGSPDDCVALFEYTGNPPDIAVDIEKPGLQIRVRSKSYATADAKIQAINALLHTLCNVTINGTRYISIFAVQSGSTPLGRDTYGRIDLVRNYLVTKGRG